MPLWLLKFLPLKKVLMKYWKPILAFLIFVSYSATLSSFVKTRINSRWELQEAKRVQAETVAQNKALSEASKIKDRQDALLLKAQEELLELREAAEDRLLLAQQEASNQRRLNDVETKDLKVIQTTDGDEPRSLDVGVRNALHNSQNRVRSRRRP